MAGQNVEVSILFADVCGSTRLYETLGDQRAQQVIGECIEFMLGIVQTHGGVLIKTIGDEIMVRFDDPNNCVRAAIEIQDKNENGKMYAGQAIQLRAGLHHGPAILDDGDVFGDAVNIAARMAGIAKAGHIVTTDTTVARLEDELRELGHEFDRTRVKGKEEELGIFRIERPDDEERTVINAPSRNAGRTEDAATLILRYGGQEVRVDTNTAQREDGFKIGRHQDCELIIPKDAAPLASRIHSAFVYRRGKFVLVDRSTNGTFVRTQDGENVFLRREEFPIWGQGTIGLGEQITEGGRHVIEFNVCEGGAS